MKFILKTHTTFSLSYRVVYIHKKTLKYNFIIQNFQSIHCRVD